MPGRPQSELRGTRAGCSFVRLCVRLCPTPARLQAPGQTTPSSTPGTHHWGNLLPHPNELLPPRPHSPQESPQRRIVYPWASLLHYRAKVYGECAYAPLRPSGTLSAGFAGGESGPKGGPSRGDGLGLAGRKEPTMVYRVVEDPGPLPPRRDGADGGAAGTDVRPGPGHPVQERKASPHQEDYQVRRGRGSARVQDAQRYWAHRRAVGVPHRGAWFLISTQPAPAATPTLRRGKLGMALLLPATDCSLDFVYPSLA